MQSCTTLTPPHELDFLSNFWSLAFHALSETLHHQIELNPLTGIFGIVQDLDLPKTMLNFLTCLISSPMNYLISKELAGTEVQ